MAFRLAALRHTRFAVTLLVLCFAAGVRAEEAQEAKEPSSQQQPAATPSPASSPTGQKGGAGHGGSASQPAVRRAAPSAA